MSKTVKKLFLIITLNLFLSGYAHAGCKNDLKWSWWKDTNVARSEFKNNGSKFIRITEIEYLDAEGSLIKSVNPTRSIFDKRPKNESKGFFVGPNEKKSYGTSIGKSIKYAKKARYDCSYQKPYEKTFSESAGDLLGSTGNVLDDVNPVNYFKKRKECKERQDRADTVAIGKRWYKECMDE